MRVYLKNISNEEMGSIFLLGEVHKFGPGEEKAFNIDCTPSTLKNFDVSHRLIKKVAYIAENGELQTLVADENYEKKPPDIVLLYGPYDEFHVFNRFNVTILIIRKDYPNSKIVAVVPYNASSIITNADEIVCFTNDKLKLVGADYPKVLDVMTDMGRYNLGYGQSGFMQKSYDYIQRKYYGLKIKTILYSDDPGFKKQQYMPLSMVVYGGGSIKSIHENIYADYLKIGSEIEKGYTITPFQKDKKTIKEKYGKLFDDKTYIILTRNFKNKQPETYNTKDSVKEIIEKIINKGYKVVNVGFPAKNFNITNERYVEISDDFPYSEFVALCYLAKAVIMNSNSGAFSTHVCTDLNLFLLGEEWDHKDLLFNYRIKRTDLFTQKVNESNIYDAIDSFQKTYKKKYTKFNDKDNVCIIDDIELCTRMPFKTLLNRHKRPQKAGVVVGLGPSLNNVLDRFNEFCEGKIVFAPNIWFRHFDRLPDYWVIANPDINIREFGDKFKKFHDYKKDSPIIVYADSVDLTPKNEVEKLMFGLPYVSYDQRHFSCKPCSSGGIEYVKYHLCCDHIEKERLTIQEELQKFTGYEQHYGSGDTVLVHMLALAIMTGCNPIEVIGADLDYRGGYCKTKTDADVSGICDATLQTPIATVLDSSQDAIKNDLYIIKESTKKIGVDVKGLKF